MRAAAARLLSALLLLAAPCVAGAEVSYPAVVPAYRMEFPRDEGSHPQYRTEWWYVTGWLETEGGDPLGFQVTFFRTRPGLDEGNPSRFAARQLLFAHVAVSDPRRGALVHDEKSAREGFDLAAAAEGKLDVHIDDWYIRRAGDSYRTYASARELTVELDLATTQPPLLQGDGGFSRKGPGDASASYYYSLPQLRARGRILVSGQEYRVHGIAWLDHEWSSTLMDEAARGWDWLGLNLDDGGALMAFRMRNEQGQEHWAAAKSRSARDGTSQSWTPSQIEWQPLRRWRSPRTGIRYPVEWKLRLGGRTLRLRPLMDDQENDARASTGTIYWEGAVRAFDEHDRQIGRGYLELTGYGGKLRF